MRRTVLVAVAVLAVAAGLALRSCGRSDTGNEDARPAADPGGPAVPAGVGPRSQRHGVPVGWSRDAAGARAAAVSAVALTGDIARAGFITRSDMITTLASRRFAPALVESSSGQLAELLGDLAAEGIAAGSVLFRELPLTARVTAADLSAARVEVWAVLVAGTAERGAPRQLWRTVSVELVWEGDDWRIDGWTAQAGPTPALATSAAISTVDELDVVTSWPTAGGA